MKTFLEHLCSSCLTISCKVLLHASYLLLYRVLNLCCVCVVLVEFAFVLVVFYSLCFQMWIANSSRLPRSEINLAAHESSLFATVSLTQYSRGGVIFVTVATIAEACKRFSCLARAVFTKSAFGIKNHCGKVRRAEKCFVCPQFFSPLHS